MMINENREILTSDRSMLELLQLSETVAKSKASILIQGSTGSGKQMLAQWIHRHSERKNKPWVIFDCSNLSYAEQEKEFIHKIESAHGGSFVILEVSKLSPLLQNKLHQVLQEGLWVRSGNQSLIPLDIRIIATTSLVLAQLVKNGDFREELFYKLNVVSLKVPNLSERMGDVETLAKALVHHWTQVHGKTITGIHEEAVRSLNAHQWPGNVRELSATLERAVLLAQEDQIQQKDIQFQPAYETLARMQMAPLTTAWKPGKTLDEIERGVILEALKFHQGNRTHTAKALGISIRTLRNKLSEFRVMGINV